MDVSPQMDMVFNLQSSSIINRSIFATVTINGLVVRDTSLLNLVTGFLSYVFKESGGWFTKLCCPIANLSRLRTFLSKHHSYLPCCFG